MADAASVGIRSSRSTDAGSVGHGQREHRIARFLAEHKVPDRYLASAIDRLARDPDDKTFALVAIDYKSLEVRHLGSSTKGSCEDPFVAGRSAVELAEFQEDAVKKARRILARYDGVLIADSVGLGKTWIGKKLLEDFAYHRRQKAVVVCPASLRETWRRELAGATIAATVVGMEELGREGFETSKIGDADVILVDESHNSLCE